MASLQLKVRKRSLCIPNQILQGLNLGLAGLELTTGISARPAATTAPDHDTWLGGRRHQLSDEPLARPGKHTEYSEIMEKIDRDVKCTTLTCISSVQMPIAVSSTKLAWREGGLGEHPLSFVNPLMQTGFHVQQPRCQCAHWEYKARPLTEAELKSAAPNYPLIGKPAVVTNDPRKHDLKCSGIVLGSRRLLPVQDKGDRKSWKRREDVRE
ncbi:unnamed protein product [Miscanthus lutarioriparius]|uniref:Uncharacterized protein n=1 Tax=Miscanthus lutarioriparius TaxID=422564 RepID=A0A811R7U6_9POAL|nr:unnamed protein product [Miscanthus lutarioriparius]